MLIRSHLDMKSVYEHCGTVVVVVVVVLGAGWVASSVPPTMSQTSNHLPVGVSA